MKTHWWLLALILTFVAGWFGGRSSLPVPAAAAEASAAHDAAPRESRAEPSRETTRKRWAEKIQERGRGDLGGVLNEIPAKDRGASIEAWLASRGIGGLDGEAKEKLRELLDSWVVADFDGAWQWAGEVRDPGLRELAMTGIAGSLAGSDPKRAFECLVAVGEFRRELDDFRLNSMMEKLSKEAAKRDASAVVDLWARLPKTAGSVGTRYGVSLELEAGTDFRTVADGLNKLVGDRHELPMFPSGVMDSWMRHDPEGATDYIVERIAAKKNFANEWWEMRGVIGKDNAPAADRWTIELLRSLPDGDRGAFFQGNNSVNDPEKMVAMLRNYATEAEATQWLGETLQLVVEGDNVSWQLPRLMQELPVEKRIEVAKSLRGTKALSAINAVMGEWKLSDAQAQEIRNTINPP